MSISVVPFLDIEVGFSLLNCGAIPLIRPSGTFSQWAKVFRFGGI
jgi:hypothetical protein